MSIVSNTQPSQSSSNSISLKELIVYVIDAVKFLFSKWLLILIFSVICAILGMLYANSKKPVYTAQATFVLEDASGKGGLGQYAGLASMMGINVGGSGGGIFQGDNIIQLYLSNNMIQRTLLSSANFDGNTQLLIERYIEYNDLRDSWKDKPYLSGLKFDNLITGPGKRVQDSVLNLITNDIKSNYLNVSRPNKTLSIVLVEVKSHDELFAKVFNEQIVENVNDFYVSTKTKKSLANVKILQNKADSVRSVMNGSINTAVSISDATPNTNPTRQIQKVAPIQRAQVSIETNKAILSELIKNLEMSKMALLQETPLIQIVDQPVLPLPMAKFGRLKGIVMGGFLGGFFIVIFLLLRRYLNFLFNDATVR